VRSAYPNWDVEDRRADVRKLERGQLVWAGGHETPVSTVNDGLLSEVADMPPESPWPITLAVSVTVAFVLLLTSHYVAAAVLFGLAGLVLAAWHSQEPEEE
jgi:hypothetical protein